MSRKGLGVLLGALALTCAPAVKYVQPYEPIRDVAVPVNSSLELSGYLYRPKGTGPFPAVVLMHNCAGVGGTVTPMENVAFHLRDTGYVALVVDSFSARNQGFTCDDPDHKSPTWRERVDDAFAAGRYLSTLSFVDSKHIGLVGWSHGAISAVLVWQQNSAASGAPRFAAVAAYYPYCVMEDISSPSVPLLILAAERDDWCPASLCQALVNRATELGHRDVSITVYPGATHSFDNPYKGKVNDFAGHHMAPDLAAGMDSRDKLFAFFDRTLKK